MVTASEIRAEGFRAHQKDWGMPLVAKTIAEMERIGADTTTKARLFAVSSTESGAWLNALPSPALSNLLDNDSLRTSVAFRLGAPVC